MRSPVTRSRTGCTRLCASCFSDFQASKETQPTYDRGPQLATTSGSCAARGRFEPTASQGHARRLTTESAGSRSRKAASTRRSGPTCISSLTGSAMVKCYAPLPPLERRTRSTCSARASRGRCERRAASILGCSRPVADLGTKDRCVFPPRYRFARAGRMAQQSSGSLPLDAVATFGSYEVGAVQRIPWPGEMAARDALQIIEHAEIVASTVRVRDEVDETTRSFVAPELSRGSGTLSQRIESWRAEQDSREVLAIDALAALERDWAHALSLDVGAAEYIDARAWRSGLGPAR